ncbi:epoxide hydrolase family protein [Kribbella sp. VKM Ac-2568]|uniref:epoxide hydrolase family protein n=1 Tax=Kribbella sp. VKM Ac-2568 TaxID=2512219 RepID=UPI001049158B|nr:epoxide hydrolase [Kribbella sp. VKM Ac-2568]TCM42795.1 pimeloyl-ACP methyl ester carboxylesterase [Kribbella sp. VKM Ac-2568]
MAITVGSANVDSAAVRPFRVEVPEADLEDLRARIRATRWPEKETVDDQSQGPQLATMHALARYWLEEYDWRKCEARMNAFEQFITEIDGLDIHFIHARSQHEDALPLIVTHGWPGSVVEQLKIIEPLTNPTAHGGSASDAFHVVVPSMPGYGYSGKPTSKGWGPDHIARAWDVLMKRLGYTRYVAQGGDWGAVVTDLLGVNEPEGLAGIHTNMPGVIPAEIDAMFFKNLLGAAPVLDSLPADLTDEERRTCEQLDPVWNGGVSYALQMAFRPQVLTGIADSPVGLASYLLDHDAKSLALISRSFAGVPEGLTRDDVLDNVTHFWLTNTGVSAGRLYAENPYSFFGVKGVTNVPVAVSVFPDELYEAPETWSRQAYPNLIHYNRLPKGGHFAAWEQPTLLVDELRTAFRSVR